MARTSRNDGVTSFDKKEKYIQINGNAIAFALGKIETVSIKT